MIRNVAFVLFGALSAAFAQTPCDNLKSLKLPDTTITAAEPVAAGPRLPAGLPAAAAQGPKIQLPAYCRVAAAYLLVM